MAMGGAGSTHSPRRAGARSNPFPARSTVEVRTEEEDFRFTYFSATVISPVAVSSKKGNKKKPKIIEVEYHKLLEEVDGSKRLKEKVPVRCVRPSPPLEEVLEGFEPGDAVDAFFQDAWWIGSVARVVEGEERRYAVTFHHPPDEREFEVSDLRVHWDWINGSWVRPHRQSTAGLKFDVGRKVEVSFDKNNHKGAWFPGTIHQDLGNETYLVECRRANSDVTTTEIVDSLHLRPCPPNFKYKNFVLLGKVDAFFDFGWWSGIIKQEFDNGIYLVFFKELNMERKFNQSQLRPHMDWKDEKWFTSSQDITNPSSEGGVHEQLICENPSASVSTVPVNNLGDGKDPCSGKASDQVDDSPGFHKTPHVRNHVTKKRGSTRKTPIKSIETLATDDLNEKDDDPHMIPEVEAIVMETLQVPNQEKTKLNKDKPINFQSDTNKTIRTCSRKRREVVVEESTNPQVNHVPKRGRRRSTILQVQDLLGASGGKSMEVNSTLEVNIVCEAAPSHAYEFENQPLSKWIKGMKKPFAVGVSKPSPVSAAEQPIENGEKNHMDIEVLDKSSEKHQASEAPIPVMVGKHSAVLVEPQKLPFVKNTLLWKTVETMEAFQRIPQSPHFQPLEDIKECLREGKAIGYMVTFAGVVGKISELQFDDSKDVTDEMMEALAELERHGFNVRPVQDRVAELLAVKEKRAKLVGNVNELNDRILERHQKKDKIEEEIDGIKEEIQKLEERLSVAESAKEKEEDELVVLADRLKETEKSIKNTRRDFEGIISCPFGLVERRRGELL